MDWEAKFKEEETVKKQREEMLRRLKAVYDKVKEENATLTEENKNLKTEKKEQSDKLKGELEEAENALADVQKELEALKKAGGAPPADAGDVGKEVKDLQHKLAQSAKECDGLKKEKAALLKEKASLVKEAQDAGSKAGESEEKKLAELQKKFERAVADVKKARGEAEQATAASTKVQEDLTSAQKEVSGLKGRLEKTKIDGVKQTKKIEEQAKKIKEQAKQIEEQTKQMGELGEECSSLKGKLKSEREKLDKLLAKGSDSDDDDDENSAAKMQVSLDRALADHADAEKALGKAREEIAALEQKLKDEVAKEQDASQGAPPPAASPPAASPPADAAGEGALKQAKQQLEKEKARCRQLRAELDDARREGGAPSDTADSEKTSGRAPMVGEFVPTSEKEAMSKKQLLALIDKLEREATTVVTTYTTEKERFDGTTQRLHRQLDKLRRSHDLLVDERDHLREGSHTKAKVAEEAKGAIAKADEEKEKARRQRRDLQTALTKKERMLADTLKRMEDYESILEQAGLMPNTARPAKKALVMAQSASVGRTGDYKQLYEDTIRERNEALEKAKQQREKISILKREVQQRNRDLAEYKARGGGGGGSSGAPGSLPGGAKAPNNLQQAHATRSSFQRAEIDELRKSGQASRSVSPGTTMHNRMLREDEIKHGLQHQPAPPARQTYDVSAEQMAYYQDPYYAYA